MAEIAENSTNAAHRNTLKKDSAEPEFIDPEVTEKFCAALRLAPNVSAACRAAGLPRTTAYRWREASVSFAADWQDALDESIDELVGEVYRRAHLGTDRPVFYQGVECGSVREYSDVLAIFLLKAHRPTVYRERVALTGENGGPIGVSEYRPVIEVPAAFPSSEAWELRNVLEDAANVATAAGAAVALPRV